MLVSEIYFNFSNKLNSNATVNMLTLRCLFKYQNETKTIAIHIFQQVKDPYPAWITGRNLILEKLKEMGITCDRIVRVSLLIQTIQDCNCYSRFAIMQLVRINLNIVYRSYETKRYRPH